MEVYPRIGQRLYYFHTANGVDMLKALPAPPVDAPTQSSSQAKKDAYSLRI